MPLPRIRIFDIVLFEGQLRASTAAIMNEYKKFISFVFMVLHDIILFYFLLIFIHRGSIVFTIFDCESYSSMC